MSSGCGGLWRRARALASATALASALAACAGGEPGPLAPVAVPNEAPRAGATPKADADHAKLVAAFGGEVRVPAIQRLLAEVTERLVKATDRPEEAYAVTVLDSPTINAFALPSGRLYVTRGLLALASDTSEIAAVLAHEIAHVTLRHANARSEMALRSALVTRVVTDVLSDAATGAVMESESKVALARFSRTQEFEADGIGVRTVARAGYDPFGAARFLAGLNRTMALRVTGAGGADMLSSHPSTPERVAQATQAARTIGAPGLGTDDRARYLAAVDGLAYGDSPADGVVRGRRFIHPRLDVAFQAPDGFVLENTARAVLGATPDGGRRLLFDAVESTVGQGLEEVLRATWSDALDPDSVQNRIVNGNAAVVATSRGKEWTFRLAAIRIGANTFRMIMATRGAVDVEAAFGRWLESARPVAPDEAAVRPLRLQVVTAAPGDTAEGLAARMVVPDRPLERFLTLNELERGRALQPGQGYKLVVE